MTDAARDEGMVLYYPSMSLCTDNAVMIAASGYYRFIAGERLSLAANPIPNLRLGQSVQSL
jgi:N6-L-threonylcarbamoyladenine synthase